MKIKLSLGIIAVLFSILSMHAQLARTVHVSSPGALSSLLSSDKNSLTELTLTGVINDTDFNTIKDMSQLKDLNISAVNIENGKIPDYAFQGKVMDRIVPPESLKAIGSGAFSRTVISSLNFTICNQLEELGIGVFSEINLTQNNELDFSRCSNLKRFLSYGENGSFSGYEGKVILPQNLKILPQLTFSKFKGSVVLPATLESIELWAFARSSPSSEIVLPSSLKMIKNEAFMKMTTSKLNLSNCNQLEELGIGVFSEINLTQNDELDFSRCSNLTRFLSHGENGSFSGYEGHVILPQNLKILPQLTFSKFKGSVVLPATLKSIELWAFARSSPSSEIILPSSLKIIKNEVFIKMTTDKLDFSNCNQLEELGIGVFSEINLTQNDELDFSRCSNLTRFLSHGENGSFAGFEGRVILPQNLKVLPQLTFSKFKGSVVLPATLESIELWAFARSSPSSEIILPSSLNTIGRESFINSAIKEICLPASLQKIENSAFSGCTQLIKITSINPTPPQLGNTVFNGVDKQTCKLYVPEASIPLYGSALQWKDFITYAIQPETGDGCLIIQAKDTLTNALINEGKYRIRGNSLDVTYIIESPKNRVIIEKLPNGQYTISEVYPPAKYKASSTREKVIEVKNTICRTVMFKNEKLVGKEDVVF